MRPRLRGLIMSCALVASGAPAGAETLRLGYAPGPDTAIVGLVLKRWAQGFAFRPEAGLGVELAAAPTPVGKLAQELGDGAVDVAWLPLDAVAPAAHPLQLLELPFQGYPAEVVAHAAATLLPGEPWREAGTATFLLAVAEAPLWLHTRAPVSELDGLRLLAPTPATADWLARLGAVPATEPKGAPLDGALLSWSQLAAMGEAGRFTQHLQVGAPPSRATALTPGLGTALWVLAIHRERLAGLPPAARDALLASAGAEVATMAGRGVDHVDRLAQQQAQRPGATLRRLDAGQLESWRAAAAATEQALLAALLERGYDAASLRRTALVALVRASSQRGKQAQARTRPPRGMGG